MSTEIDVSSRVKAAALLAVTAAAWLIPGWGWIVTVVLAAATVLVAIVPPRAARALRLLGYAGPVLGAAALSTVYVFGEGIPESGDVDPGTTVPWLVTAAMAFVAGGLFISVPARVAASWLEPTDTDAPSAHIGH